MDILSGEVTLATVFSLPSEKGSTLKEKEFGSKFVSFIVDPFHKITGTQERNRKLQMLLPL